MPLPWTQIIQWVPPIVELSRDLLQRSKQRPASGTDLTPIDSTADMASRVAALEENERRQAELVSQMAQHQGQLSTAVVELHAKLQRLTRWLIAATLVLTAAIVASVVLLLRTSSVSIGMAGSRAHSLSEPS